MRNELFERVCEDLKGLLREEPYRSGARLPSERALSARFGVGRSTVREAVRALVNLGLLSTRRGSGTTLRSDPGGILHASVEALLIVGESPVEDLFEARELVEVFLAGRAAVRRTDEDLAEISAASLALRDEGPDGYAAANVRFHAAVARAAHNALLGRFMETLVGGIDFTVRATLPAVENPEETVLAHEAIAEAIRRGDSEAAEAAMRRHMAMARDEWRRMS